MTQAIFGPTEEGGDQGWIWASCSSIPTTGAELTQGPGGCLLESWLRGPQAAPSLAGDTEAGPCWETHGCQCLTSALGLPTAWLSLP